MGQKGTVFASVDDLVKQTGVVVALFKFGPFDVGHHGAVGAAGGAAALRGVSGVRGGGGGGSGDGGIGVVPLCKSFVEGCFIPSDTFFFAEGWFDVCFLEGVGGSGGVLLRQRCGEFVVLGKQQALVQGILLLFLIELLGEGVHEGIFPPVGCTTALKTLLQLSSTIGNRTMYVQSVTANS